MFDLITYEIDNYRDLQSRGALGVSRTVAQTVSVVCGG